MEKYYFWSSLENDGSIEKVVSEKFEEMFLSLIFGNKIYNLSHYFFLGKKIFSISLNSFPLHFLHYYVFEKKINDTIYSLYMSFYLFSKKYSNRENREEKNGDNFYVNAFKL